jgi:septal ring factor EnvC (AmiA/AmiB activator)
MYEVYRDMYDALGVKDTDRIMRRVPDEEPVPKDPAQENIDVLDMVTLKAFQGQDHESHIMAHLVFGASPMIANMPPAAIALQKHCMEHVQIQAEEMAMMEMRNQGPMAPEQQEMLMESIKAKFVAQGMQQLRQLSQQASGQGPDPLVQLKEKELQLRAQAEQNDAQNDQAKLNLEAQNQRLRADQFQQRLASQERQTGARIDAAMQREFIKSKGQ